MGIHYNRKYGKDFIDIIKNMLEKGASKHKIMLELNIPYSSLYHVMVSNNLIEKRVAQQKQSTQNKLFNNINEIKELLKKGIHISNLAFKYSVSHHSMHFFLVKNNLLSTEEMKIKDQHYDIYDLIIEYQKMGIKKISAIVVGQKLNIEYNVLKSIFRTFGGRDNFMEIMSKKVRHPDLFNRLKEINLEKKKPLPSKNDCEKSELEAIKIRVENLEMHIEILTDKLKELLSCQKL